MIISDENGKRTVYWNGRLCIFFLVYEDDYKTAWMMQGDDRVFWEKKSYA